VSSLEIPDDHLPSPPLGVSAYLHRDCLLLLSTTHEILKVEAPRLEDRVVGFVNDDMRSSMARGIHADFMEWFRQGGG